MENYPIFNASPHSSNFILNEEMFTIFQGIKPDLTKVVKSHLKDEIWEVAKYLSTEECEKLIQFCENIGFSNSRITLPNEPNKFLRNLDRILLSDAQTSVFLSNLLVKYLPLANEGGIFDGINKNFKFYKYEKEMMYGPHVDGESEDKERRTKSVGSIIFYLNTVEKGGLTRFISDSLNQVTFFSMVFVKN